MRQGPAIPSVPPTGPGGPGASDLPAPPGWVPLDSPAAGVALKEYLSGVSARRWSLLGIFVLVTTLAALYAYSRVPIYQASVLMLIEPRTLNLTDAQDVYDPTSLGWDYQQYLTTQLELMQSRRVMGEAIKRLWAGGRTEFKGSNDPAGALQGGVIVEPQRESRLVRVGYRSPDPKFAAAAANAIVRQFIEDSQRRSMGISDTGLKQLKQMEKEQRPKYEASTQALEQYRKAAGLTGEGPSNTALQAQVDTLTTELARVHAERLAADSELGALEEVLAMAHEPGEVLAVQQSQLVAELRVARDEAGKTRTDLLDRFGKRHPLVAEVDLELKTIRAKLVAEEQRLLADVRHRAQTLHLQEERLNQEVEVLQNRLYDLAARGTRLKILQEEADTVARSYKRLIERIEEIEVAMAAGSKENNLFIIDEARVPGGAIYPNTSRTILMGALLGLLAGVGLCLLLEYLDNTLKGQDDVERVLGLPVLGVIPRVNLERQLEVPIELYTRHQTRSHITEAFNTVRTGLRFTLPGDAPRVVVITSGGAREGKTFTAINMAETLARSGQRVLLIDADLRKPRIQAIYGLDEGPGLSNILASGTRGPTTLELTRSSGNEQLDLLTSGPIPPNPSELLAQDTLREFIDEASRRYDWIIFDSPPILEVTDAATLLGSVPHVLFVLKGFSTTREAARRSHAILSGTPAHVIGVIVNNVEAPRRSGYYGYGYGYGSGYYYHEDAFEQEQVPALEPEVR